MSRILSHFPPGSNKLFSVIIVTFPSKLAGPGHYIKVAMETHD